MQMMRCKRDAEVGRTVEFRKVTQRIGMIQELFVVILNGDGDPRYFRPGDVRRSPRERG